MKELKIRRHLARDWIELVLTNPKDRGNKILIADSHEIADYNLKHPDKPLKMLDERIMMFNDLFLVGKYHNEFDFLNSLLKKAALRLRENGLLDQIIAKYVDSKKLRPPPEESEPVVLTLDHVGVAFKLCGGFFALGLVVFMIERLMMYAKALVIPFKLAINYLFEFTH